jgi:hypothetical protein
MRVIAMLSWYDEPPLALSALVTSLAGVADHIVAVDGAYHLFPGGTARSSRDEVAAIVETCRAAGIGCTPHQPQTVWYGNEIEKRDTLVRLAAGIAEPGVDWLFRIDADEQVTQAPFDLHDRLAATDADAGVVTLWAGGGASTNPRAPFLMRAHADMRCEHNHYTYTGVNRDGDRVTLSVGEETGPTVDCTDLRVEHREMRSFVRHQAKLDYYRMRNELGIEHLPGMPVTA